MIPPCRTCDSYGAIDLNGSSAYIDQGTVGRFTTQDFSISYWVYAKTLTTNQAGQGPVIFQAGEFNIGGWYTSINDAGAILFITNQTAANQQSLSASGTITTLRWTHVACTRSGTSARVYKDGVDVTSTAGSHTNPSAYSSQNTFVGLYQISPATPFIYANVIIEDLRLYTRVLSAKEIASLANSRIKFLPNETDITRMPLYSRMSEGINGQVNGVAKDFSGNGNNGTLTGGAIWRGSSWLNYP